MKDFNVGSSAGNSFFAVAAGVRTLSTYLFFHVKVAEMFRKSFVLYAPGL